MFKNILIVCIGNICRSPMGEAIFKHFIHKNAIEATVSSAGISALIDRPADPFVCEILKAQGIDCSAHRASQLTEAKLSAADLVLVMEENQRKEIERFMPSACGKVHLLGKWKQLEIPDPYKKPKVFFEQTYQLITQSATAWQEKIWK